MSVEIDIEAIHAVFVAEAAELLDQMEGSLVTLEGVPDDPETLATIFRVVHTIKGSAASVQIPAAAELAHGLEEVLDELRQGRARADRDAITLLLRAVDELRLLVEAGPGSAPGLAESQEKLLAALKATLSAPGTATAVAAAGAATPASAVAPDRTLRVAVGRLDRMVDLTGEIAIARGRLGQLIASLPDAHRDGLGELHEEVDRLQRELQELVLRVRMVPVGPTFRQLARTVRDVAASHGKEVRLDLSGEDVEVDTTVVEHLRAPLTHMIRNAVDHGIEPPEARIAAGKPRSGRIRVRARHHAGSVVVEVADDGVGLSPRKIAARARARGLTSDTDLPSDTELLQLVFEPGFSTADKVTETSGRGVGLDVVRRNVEAVRGTVSVDSQEGAGSVFTLRLPLTLAIIQGFHVNVGGEGLVVPLDVVTECLELPTSHRPGRPGYGTLTLRGKPLPYLRLREHLGLGGNPSQREQVVVVRHEEDLLGLVVDRLDGERQTVVKPLGRPLVGLAGLAAATVLRDGRIGLILDIPGLVQELRASEPDGAAARPHQEEA